MGVYLFDITMAVLLFPFVAAAFTLPYLVYRYRRFGAVPWLRALGVYSFILYLMCVYFLVILPLPADRTAVVPYAATPQLVPFHFLEAFAAISPFAADDPSTWLPTLKAFWAAQFDVLFNVLMTVPLGMYLRYFFRRSWPAVFALGFGFTLFLELSQLTGLWGLYAHPYRLFDVDDLIVNTTGAVLGAALVTPLMRVLPDMRLVEAAGEEAGVRASVLRRAVSFAIDCALVAVLTGAAFVVAEGGPAAALAVADGSWQGRLDALLALLGWGTAAFVVLFGVVPAATHGRTAGQKVLRLVVVRPDASDVRWWQPFARYGLLFVLLAVPLALLLFVVVAGAGGFATIDAGTSPEFGAVAGFAGRNAGLLLGAWCVGFAAWLVSLVARAVRARRRGVSLVMLNGLLTFTRVMTEEGVRRARERNVVLSVEEVVAREQAIAAAGTTLRELMERAGHAVAEQVRRWVPDAAPVVVLCGSGNNGGDGWVVARDLARDGYRVTLVVPDLAERVHAEPALSAAQDVFAAAAEERLPLQVVVRPEREQLDALLDEAAAVVDAMLGTGFSGDTVREPYASWIAAANARRFAGRRAKGRGRHRARERAVDVATQAERASADVDGKNRKDVAEGAHAAVEPPRARRCVARRVVLPPKAPRAPFAIAIDVPSGLSAQTGQVADACFAADITVTMIAYKPGLVQNATTPWTGVVRLAPLVEESE